jgi:hypothetical protein
MTCAFGGARSVSKYRPLQNYLHERNDEIVELSFIEIERIIGDDLPPSAYAARWWMSANLDHRHALWQSAWHNEGYTAKLLLGADRVEFRKQS